MAAATVTTLVEHVDLEMAGRVLESPLLRGDSGGAVELRREVQRYLEAAAAGGGCVSVEYSLSSKGCGLGRLYARPVAEGVRLSLTTMPRGVRAALARRLYHDVDMRNAHPSLALQLARRAGVSEGRLASLRRLCEDREACLREVQDATGAGREGAKQLFLRVLNSGSAQRWAASVCEAASGRQEHDREEEGEEEEAAADATAPPRLPQLVRTLEEDVGHVAAAVVAAHPGVLARVAAAKRARRPLVTAFALICQDYERQCLMAMHGAAERELRRGVGALIYDGLLLRRASESGGAAGGERLDPYLLRVLEDAAREATGLVVQLEEKEMAMSWLYCSRDGTGVPRPPPELTRRVEAVLGGRTQVTDACLDAACGEMPFTTSDLQDGVVKLPRFCAVLVAGRLRGCAVPHHVYPVGKLAELPGVNSGVADLAALREWAMDVSRFPEALTLASSDGAARISFEMLEQGARVKSAVMSFAPGSKRTALSLSPNAQALVMRRAAEAFVREVLGVQLRLGDAVLDGVRRAMLGDIKDSLRECLREEREVEDARRQARRRKRAACAAAMHEEGAYLELRARFEEANFHHEDETEYVELAGDRLIRRSQTKLFERYASLTYASELLDGERVAFVRTWVADPEKRAYRRMEFHPPPQEAPPGVFNTWRGFRAAGLPPLPEGFDREAAVAPYLELVALVCGRDPAAARYDLLHDAHLMQRPGERSRVAVTYFSERQGVGKSFKAKVVARHLVGERYSLQTSDVERFVAGTFATKNREELLYVVLDEVKRETMLRHHERLLGLVSEDRVVLEFKYATASSAPDYHRQVRTTNNADAVVIPPHDRRNVVFEASAERAVDNEYFAALERHMREPANARAVYDHLMGLDLAGFDFVRDRPRTLIYEQMAAASPLPPLVAFAHQALARPERLRELLLPRSCAGGSEPPSPPAAHKLPHAEPLLGPDAYVISGAAAHAAFLRFQSHAEGGGGDAAAPPASRAAGRAGAALASERAFGAALTRMASEPGCPVDKSPAPQRRYGSTPCVWYTVRPASLKEWLTGKYRALAAE